MNYIGDYQNNKIYGTSDNRFIKVNTVDDANFLLCEVTVVFNGNTWNHPFEVPFYNNSAEFYFENYIHSIIIQSLEESIVSVSELSIVSFDLASVNVVLKEMKQSEELSELEYDFYMALGSFDVIDYTSVQNGEKLLLNTLNSKFITQDGLLSFSFLSLTQPEEIRVSVDGVLTQIQSPTNALNRLLHSVLIPISSIVDPSEISFSLSAKFSDSSIIELGNYVISDSGPDHELVFYQNYFGTLSVFEFTGKKSLPEEFKIGNIINSNNVATRSRTNNIQFNALKTLNTGQILDKMKYDMLRELLKSYNIFCAVESNLKRMVVRGKPRIRPYITDEHLRDETLTFKVSENDNILYRGF